MTSSKHIIFQYHSITCQKMERQDIYWLEADVLMVSKNTEEYTLLSDIDYYMCNKHKLPFCNPKAVFYPTNMNKLCIMALFMKIETDIKRFCKQTVVLNQ